MSDSVSTSAQPSTEIILGPNEPENPPPPSPIKSGTGATGIGPSAGTGTGGGSEPIPEDIAEDVKKTPISIEITEHLKQTDTDIQLDILIPEEKEPTLTIFTPLPNLLYILIIAFISLAIAIIVSRLKKVIFG